MENGLAAASVKPYKSSFNNRMGAYLTGLSNVPVDIFKYSGIGANKLMNMTGLRDDATAKRVHSAFVNIKNPLDFRNYEENEPAMYTLGNVVGNALGAGKVVKTVAGPTKSFGTKGLATAFAGGAAGEAAIEPWADGWYDNSPKNTPVVQATGTNAPKPEVPMNNTSSGLSPAQIERLAEIESAGKGYDAHNTSSGAFGRYQFIPSTAAAYAKKLGLKGDEWKTPENQDKMFAAFTQDNVRALEKKGLPTDLFHVYGAHQQGATGFSNILEGNLTPKLERNMRNNLPSDMRNLEGMALRDAWVDYWKSRTEV